MGLFEGKSSTTRFLKSTHLGELNLQVFLFYGVFSFFRISLLVVYHIQTLQFLVLKKNLIAFGKESVWLVFIEIKHFVFKCLKRTFPLSLLHAFHLVLIRLENWSKSVVTLFDFYFSPLHTKPKSLGIKHLNKTPSLASPTWKWHPRGRAYAVLRPRYKFTEDFGIYWLSTRLPYRSGVWSAGVGPYIKPRTGLLLKCLRDSSPNITQTILSLAIWVVPVLKSLP